MQKGGGSGRAAPFHSPPLSGIDCRERWCCAVNPETEREVWSRVLAPGQMTAEEALLPERLETLISLEQRNAAELRAVSARLNGRDRTAFLRMAARDEARAAELRGTYYLLTGRKIRLSGRGEPLPRDLPEALRMLWLRRREMERSYGDLSRDFSAYAGTFDRFSAETRRQMDRISAVLRGKLG